METLARHFDTALDTPDGIKKLRELILSLAMKGKLVPQDAKEQPASELLKEIEKEKTRLVKEGIFKEQDILPDMRIEEQLYILPKGWVWCRIQDLGFVLGGKRIPKGYDYSVTETPFRYLTVTNMKDGSIVDNNIKYIDETVRTIIGKYIINKEDIYITIAGTIGAVGSIPEEYDGMNLTENASRLVFYKAYKEFLIRLLSSEVVQSQFAVLTNKQAQPKLSLRSILATLIPLPPLAEQKRIVEKIDQLMSLCDKLEAERNERDNKRISVHTAAVNRLLVASDKPNFNKSWSFITKNFNELYSVTPNVAELKKAILQLAVMGKLVPQDKNDQPASELLKEIEREKARLIKEGRIKKQEALPAIKAEEIPYQIPEGWVWVRLGEIISLLGDGIHGTPDYDDYGEYYFINGNNLSDGIIEIKENTKRVSEKEYNKYKKELNSNTVFVSINGTIGNVAFYNNEKVILGKSACYFNLFELIDKGYIKKVLNSEYFLSYALSSATGSTIKNVSLKAMREFRLPLPPLAEQKRIVAKIDQLMELCNSLEQGIKVATEKRSRVLGAVLARV